MYKIVTLKANAKKIVTWKCICHHISTKPLLWRQMLRKSLLENAIDTKYVILKANAKGIVTWKCVWHQICSKMSLWRQMFRKSSLENAFGTKYVQNCYFKGKCSGYCHFLIHVAPNMYKTITVNSNAKKIVTLKCIWHHICAKLLLCRQMVRKSLLTNAFGTKYVQNRYFEGKW